MPKRLTINPNLLKTRVPGDRRGTIIHRAKKEILPRKTKHKKRLREREMRGNDNH